MAKRWIHPYAISKWYLPDHLFNVFLHLTYNMYEKDRKARWFLFPEIVVPSKSCDLKTASYFSESKQLLYTNLY